jgi:hypothetical protein
MHTGVSDSRSPGCSKSSQFKGSEPSSSLGQPVVEPRRERGAACRISELVASLGQLRVSQYQQGGERCSLYSLFSSFFLFAGFFEVLPSQMRLDTEAERATSTQFPVCAYVDASQISFLRSSFYLKESCSKISVGQITH